MPRSAPNWDKFNREKRLTYVPSQRSQPATQKQLDYIVSLAYEKGRPKPHLPKTKKGASDLIERLLALPDVDGRKGQPVRLALVAPPEPPSTARELVAELRERFPQLTPMTANSMAQLFMQLDELATALVFDSLMHEQTPENANELILHILRRFLEEFTPVSDDETALVAGQRPD